jgi:imidazolonepropionase-like amidohydrolase
MTHGWGASRLAISIAAALVGVAATAAEKPGSVAIVGARIEPVSGPAIARGTLVMRGGVIEALGADVDVPSDARQIDAAGLTLTPGLIDAFGGIGLPVAKAGSARGAASGDEAPGLTPEARALDRIDVSKALEARDAGVTTALVVSSEGVLPGRSALVDLHGEAAEDLVVRLVAAQHLHLTSLRGRYPGSLQGTMALIRQSLLDAIHYRDIWQAWETAPRGRPRPGYDAGLAAWQDVIDQSVPLVVTANRENDIPRALSLAEEFDLRLVLAGLPAAWRQLELLKQRRPTLLVSVNFDPPRPEPYSSFPDEQKEAREIVEAKKGPAKLHAAGIAFALVSGHAKDFVAGVRTAVDEGLPREAALRGVTLAAAQALGIAEFTGSLEAGKQANVVAWSGEPLSEGAVAKLVFVNGWLHEPAPEKKDEPGKNGSEPEGSR